MTESPLAPLFALLGHDLRPIAGASVSADVPIAEDFINRQIAGQLATASGPVSAVRLQLLPSNRIRAFVTLRTPAFLPPVRAEIEVTGQPRFPDHPVLDLRWALPGFGLLARFASPVLALLDALPPGITVEGDRLRVDLGQWLRTQGLDDLARYVTTLEVGTRAGVAVIRVAARVEPPGAEGVSPPGAL